MSFAWVIKLASGLHLVSPGSSFMSSMSATSISGLRVGEKSTDTTSGDPGSILPGESTWLDGGILSLSAGAGSSVPFTPIWEEDAFWIGSRTLMVTLLGIRSIGEEL